MKFNTPHFNNKYKEKGKSYLDYLEESIRNDPAHYKIYKSKDKQNEKK